MKITNPLKITDETKKDIKIILSLTISFIIIVYSNNILSSITYLPQNRNFIFNNIKKVEKILSRIPFFTYFQKRKVSENKNLHIRKSINKRNKIGYLSLFFINPTLTLIPTPTLTPKPPKQNFFTPITNTPTPFPIRKNYENNCPTASNNVYQSLSISPESFHPENNPDINLDLRGYKPTQGKLELVNYRGGTDPLAPQLSTLLRNGSKFVALYQVYNWNWFKNTRGSIITTPYSVTLVGLWAKRGQSVLLPQSGYKITGNYQAIVLYATSTKLTLKYTKEDNVIHGYTIHLDGLCVDPNLLNLYRKLNKEGRHYLPALRGGEKLGTALSNEIKVAIRDTGMFMDPRSRKDWWKGF